MATAVALPTAAISSADCGRGGGGLRAYQAHAPQQPQQPQEAPWASERQQRQHRLTACRSLSDRPPAPASATTWAASSVEGM